MNDDLIIDRRQLLGYAGATTALSLLTACTTTQEVASVTSAALTHRIVGDPRPDGFTVSLRAPDASGVRLTVGRDPDLDGDVVHSSRVVPDAEGWAKVTVTDLDAASEYYYEIEVTDAAGSRMSGQVGRAKTLPRPGTAASFSFAFGSCMATGSTRRDVMDRILSRDPLLFLHLGDFGYFDNRSSRQASHRRDFQSQMSANSGLRQVLAEIPTLYVQSDHDAGGGNGSRPGPWTAPNRAAYRQIFPHPDISGHEDGLYWSILVGRVRMIFTDHMTLSSPAADPDGPAKTMMGSAQKEWFTSELREPEPLKIWVQHSPFINTSLNPESWGNYAWEQTELAAFIRDQAVGDVVTVHGDMHAVAVSTANPWGLRSWCAAPFDADSSHKGGPWTSGPFPEVEDRQSRQYGLVEVTDVGDRIDVVFTGYDSEDTPLVSDTMSVTNVGQTVLS